MTTTAGTVAAGPTTDRERRGGGLRVSAWRRWRQATYGRRLALRR